MPDLTGGLGQDEMRERIRHERRIELVYEEHRFYDIRRWEIAEDLLNGPMQGIEMTVDEGTGDVIYTKFDFEERSFPAKLYVLPIPQNEMDKSPGLTQVAGW
jgi:hypothetical protein